MDIGTQHGGFRGERVAQVGHEAKHRAHCLKVRLGVGRDVDVVEFPEQCAALVNVKRTGEKATNDRHHLLKMSLQEKVAAIQKVNLRVGDIATKGLGADWQEKRIVPAPHGKQRRQMGSEIGLEMRIRVDIGLIIADQVKLNVVTAGSLEKMLVEGIGLGGNQRRVGLAVLILEPGRFKGKKSAK